MRAGSDTIRLIVVRIEIHPERVVIDLSRAGIAHVLGLPGPEAKSDNIIHEIAVSLKRSGLAVRLICGNGVRANDEPDPSLVRLLCQARVWWQELAKGETTIASLSRAEGVTASWMTRVIRLAFLSPEVVEAIIAGQVASDVDQKALLPIGAISADWGQQVRLVLRKTA